MEVTKPQKINMTVLYCEDDVYTGEVVDTMLKRRVSSVQWKQNGKEGLDSFMTSTPDLVITDGTMPEMTGFEMAREIRKTNSTIPIIFTTAHEEKEYIDQIYEIENTDYILKPIDKDKLKNLLEKYSPKAI